MNLMIACRLEHDNQQHLLLAARSPFQDTVAELPLAQVPSMLVIAMLTTSIDRGQHTAGSHCKLPGSLCG